MKKGAGFFLNKVKCYLFSPWLISAALHFLPSTGDHTIPNALGKSPELFKYKDEIFVNESP